MNNSNAKPKLIISEKPELIIPDQPTTKNQEQVQRFPQMTFEQGLDMFAHNLELIADELGVDNIEFNANSPNGYPIFIHFSRKEVSKTCSKWVNKGLKRIRKKEKGGADGKKQE